MTSPQAFSTLDYVKAFVRAAEHVLGMTIGETPDKGAPAFHVDPTFNLQNVNIFLGITGDLNGQVNFGMDMPTALGISSAMMMETVTELDEISISAIQELANMISGNATMILGESDLKLDITPPSLVMGKDMTATWHKTRALAVPLKLSCGVITVTAGICPPKVTA